MEPDPCGCHFAGTTATWCAYHRAIALHAIGRIRAATGWEKPAGTTGTTPVWREMLSPSGAPATDTPDGKETSWRTVVPPDRERT